MTGAGARSAYADAFIRQARSDWQAYLVLERSQVSSCHYLHYLQMVCEKVAKAYRLRDTQSPVVDLVDGVVIAPCDFDFPSLGLLRQAGGRAFLKLVGRALDDFERVTLP